MSSENMRSMEKRIVTLAVEGLVNEGYRVGIRSADGFDILQGPTTDVASIVARALKAGESMLTVWQERAFKGSVTLIFGRGGHEVIAANSAALASILKPARELAQQPAQALDRKQALALIYRHTSRDYKGRLADGTRSVMVCRGATCLVPLEALTDAEIADRLPLAQKKEAERLAAKGGK